MKKKTAENHIQQLEDKQKKTGKLLPSNSSTYRQKFMNWNSIKNYVI